LSDIYHDNGFLFPRSVFPPYISGFTLRALTLGYKITQSVVQFVTKVSSFNNTSSKGNSSSNNNNSKTNTESWKEME